MHQRAEFVSIISLWLYYHLSTLSTPPPTTYGSDYSPYSQHSAIFFRRRYPAAGFFQIPWASTNPWTTTRMHLTLTNHPPCWCSQTILATSTYLPTSLFQQRQIYSFPLLSSDTSGTDERNIHLDDLRHSRPSSIASNYPSRPHLNPSLIHLLDYPSILETWLSIRQTRIPHLFPRSQRPKSFACQ